MQICVDACCLINLINGRVLFAVAQRGTRLSFQGLVADEVVAYNDVLNSVVEAGLLVPLGGSDVYASEVGRIASKYNLGLGESECIAIAQKASYRIASDDGRARHAALQELGAGRVTGSIGLLRTAVIEGSLTFDEAVSAYEEMRRAGGFLPAFRPDFFRS